MSDPWTAKGASQVSNERRSRLDDFLGRLVALGATRDEVADFRAAWDSVDDDDDAAAAEASRARVLAMTDDEITAEIEAIRREYREHTGAPLPPPPMDESTSDIMEWVRADPGDVEQRARAALDAEKETAKPRVTLVRQLEALLADAASG